MRRWLSEWVRRLLLPIIRDAVAPLHAEVSQLRQELVDAGIAIIPPPKAMQHDCGHESVSSAHSRKTGKRVCLRCYRGDEAA